MKVLVAVDGSEFANQALEFYLTRIRRPGDELYIVHAVEFPYSPNQSMYVMDPVEPAIGAAPLINPDATKRLLHKAQEDADAIDAKYKKILDAKQIQYHKITAFARPSEFIVKEAQEKEVQLVVIGSRGMGKLRRTLIGSVSDYVLHHCHCAVIVARH